MINDVILTVVSNPKVINMKKNSNPQRVEGFNEDIASGYTMKIKPTSVKSISFIKIMSPFFNFKIFY